jgi:hypothetical protein
MTVIFVAAKITAAKEYRSRTKEQGNFKSFHLRPCPLLAGRVDFAGISNRFAHLLFLLSFLCCLFVFP